MQEQLEVFLSQSNQVRSFSHDSIDDLAEIRTNLMMTKNVRIEQRGRSPLIVPKRGSEDVTRTTNMKRSQSIENLHQRGPKQELMKPVLQQNLTVFDGKFKYDFFYSPQGFRTFSWM